MLITLSVSRLLINQSINQSINIKIYSSRPPPKHYILAKYDTMNQFK